MIIYVNAQAFRDGDGSRERPYKRISDAAVIAMPGDEVVVAPGVYRENVAPAHAGTEEARITYRSEVPLGAEITGAEEVKDWKQVDGTVWMTEIPNSDFGGYNPYTTYVFGDWFFAKRDKHTGCVWLNDQAMYESVSLEECRQAPLSEVSWDPEASKYRWYTEQDPARDVTRIYGAVEIKLMGVLVEQPLGITVFTVDYYEGILNHPLNTLSGVKIAVMVEMFHSYHS